MSLRNRIDVAIAVTTLGLKLFCERILQGFGIPITEDIDHFLHVINNKRDKRIAKTKTNDAKKERQKKFHAKLKAHTDDAATNRAKAEGTREPGIGVDGGYIEEDFNDNNNKKKRKRTQNLCPLPLCGLKGHKTSRSKKCKHNKENPRHVGDDAVADLDNEPAATDDAAATTEEQTDDNNAAQVGRDAEECDLMDMQRLDDSRASDAFWSAEEHNSEGSCSDSETAQHGVLQLMQH